MTITHWMGMSKSNWSVYRCLDSYTRFTHLGGDPSNYLSAPSPNTDRGRAVRNAIQSKQVVSESNTISIQYLYTLFIYITESSTHPPPPPEGYTSSSGPQPASSLCFTA